MRQNSTTLTGRQELLEGWGRYLKGTATVYQPELLPQIKALVKKSGNRSLLAIGRGRSYGDSCLNSGYGAVNIDRLDHAFEFDREKGIFSVEAGITLENILSVIVPAGWFLPVTPGTRYPSIGGCIAADVHGKNHHIAGSIGSHVRWIELVTASGEVIRCTHRKSRDLFDATVGGMGLTGIIYRVSLKLMRIPSAYIYAQHIRVANLLEMMETLEVSDLDSPYTVAWVDCTASGEETGKGEVILGRHAEPDELPAANRDKPYSFSRQRSVELNFSSPFSFVNPVTSRWFNNLYLRKGGGNPTREKTVPYDRFFYPLDAVRKWNRIYGRRGFIQYQFVAPNGEGYEAVSTILRECLQADHPSSLAVFKKFGKQEGLLSFPMPGWNLALDIAVRPGLLPLLDRLDEIVINHGGRIYLAKDARMKAETFHTMYPELGRWREIKRKTDPEGIFSSDQARRLRMMEDIL